MEAIVYGTYCNPSPQFGLSFYCQGTTACDVFRNFTAVSCVSQPDRLYCTNQQTCGGANFTNDIYITYPLDGHFTATDYDTVTRSAYQFNQTIPVAAYSTSTNRRNNLIEDVYPRAATTSSIPQQAQTIFQNVYNGNSTNPSRMLVNSLASTLQTLKAAGSMTTSNLQNKLRDTLFAALSPSLNQTVTEVQQCKEINATADGMFSVNQRFINNITSQMTPTSLQIWLLTNFVEHIVVNAAVAQEVDIIKSLVQSSSASSCAAVSKSTTSATTLISSTTGKTSSKTSTTIPSSSTTPSKTVSTTSKASTTSSTTSSTSSSTSSSTTSTTRTNSTSTNTKSSSSSSTTSSSSSSSPVPTKTSTTSSTTSATLLVSSVSTTACPSATPTGQVIYKSNSTQNQALGGGFSIYNGTSTHLQNILVSPVNASSALYSFPDANSIAVTLPDGESLVYTANASSVTYIQSGCSSALIYSNCSVSNVPSRKLRRAPLSSRASGGVSVVMAVQDQCQHPVTSGYALQLDCANVLYPQQYAASGPVVQSPSPVPFDNTGGGTYTATCDLTSLNSANAAYDTCMREDAQSMQNFCGKQKKQVHNVKDFIEKYIEEAKKYAELVKFVSILKTVLTKTSPALNFWDKMCDDKYGLMNPYVQAQFDADDCGYAAALSMGLEGRDGHGAIFSQALGTFSATPTTVFLSTMTSIATTTCSTTTSSSTATPSYLPYQTIGTDTVCDTPGSNSIVAYNSGYIYCYNCWNDLAGNVYHVLCSACSKFCCFAATKAQFDGLESQSNYYIIGGGIACQSSGFGVNDACKNNDVITPNLCATNTSSKTGPNYGYFNANRTRSRA